MQVIKPGSLTLQHGISMYVCNLRRMPKWKIQTYHLSDFFFSQLTKGQLISKANYQVVDSSKK